MLPHVRTLRVRYYECDLYGHVNHANYLRYMQEAAFDASAAVGYNLDRYAELGRSWLIRETEIEYLRPLRYGDSVQVTTWVADMRRVRSRRAYELRRAGSSELAARAVTDWAFMDSATGRSAPIPAEIKAAFVAEGAPTVPPRRRFPVPPSPPAGAFRQQRRVEWRDLDQVGHVNNAVYLSYIEDCAIQAARGSGWPQARMAAEGFNIVTREHRIEYLQPALLDDELTLTTWISSVGRSSMVRHLTIARATDGELLSQARTVSVWIDTETRQPMPIPDQFLADLAPGIAIEEPWHA
jgi:acyl-CoA thioester hydrolase